jgi:epoxyqueuosine reductase QueG
MKMNEHPTVVKMTATKPPEPPNRPLDAEWLKKMALECSADEAGFVALESEYLDDQRDEILRSFPHGRSVVSIMCKMNEYSIRAPQRSVANHEFHHTGKHVDTVCRDFTRKLNDNGIRALNEPMAFPMEYADFLEGKTWIISHKMVAVAAGMGQMGIHRNVIHPKFGILFCWARW